MAKRKGIPSLANIMAIGNALNETGLMDVLTSAFGPDANLIDSFGDWAGTADPLSIIDAIIPFVILRMMRKFTGPIRAGPIAIL